MRRWGTVRAAVLAGPALAGLATASLVRAETSRNDLPRVITHTREYCEELSTRAMQLRLARGEAPAEADLLAAEGDRLCAHGQIRPGIMRLRRAIMLLRTEAAPGR